MTLMLSDLAGQMEFFFYRKNCPQLLKLLPLYTETWGVLIKQRRTQSNKRIFSGRGDTTVFLVRRRTVCHVMSSWHVIMSSWWSDSIQPCDSIFRGCVLLILSAAAIWSLNHQQRGWRSLNTRTDIRWDTTRSADTETWDEPNYPCE